MSVAVLWFASAIWMMAEVTSITQDTMIPVLDLRQDEQSIVNTLYTAATEYGFFFLVGHNLSFELKHNLLSESHHFFDLDDSIKNELKYVIGTNFGYLPFEAQVLNQTLSKYGDTNEGYYVCDDTIEHDPNNGWSYQNAWPPRELLPDFKPTLMRYFSEMKQLGYAMNEYVALSLNLSRNYFNVNQIFGDKPLPALRMIHYLPIVSDEEIGRFGTGQHTDFGFMTFLITDGVQGLQILHGDEWMDVHESNIEAHEPVIIVNIGDELQMSTNGHYLSTKHRVFAKEPNHRYSAAFFWEPNLSAVIKCVESICGDEGWNEIPKYDTVTHRQHLTKK
eukprot:223311_1